MNVRVPLLNIHTPQFVSIRIFVPYTKQRIASTVPFFSYLKPVGVAQGITKFVREQSRETSKIYGFNGDEFQPLWVIPGQMSTKLRLSRIVFHRHDLLQELGFLRGNLLSQENPFVIVEDQYVLRDPTLEIGGRKLLSGEPEVTLGRSIFYHDCWLTNNPITYDIDTNDMIIIPEFDVEVGKITTSEETASTLMEEAVSTLTTKVTQWFNKK